MNKIILGAIIFSLMFIGCKKDKAPTCATTVGGIAGAYKLTKVELISAGGTASDVTSTFVSTCQLGATYRFNADKTANYIESTTSCTDSYNGTWDVVNSTFTLGSSGFSEFSNAPISSWDCTTLVISETGTVAGNPVTQKTYFTKQP